MSSLATDTEVIHNVIRNLLQSVIKNSKGVESADFEAFRFYSEQTAHFIHHHHSNEDDVIFKAFLKYSEGKEVNEAVKAHVAKLSSEHRELDSLLGQLDAVVAEKPPTQEGVSKMGDLAQQIFDFLNPHLLYEETELNGQFLERFLSPEDCAIINKDILEHVQKEGGEMFVLVRFNMSPEDSKRFIALDSLPWIVKNILGPIWANKSGYKAAHKFSMYPIYGFWGYGF